MKDDSPLRRNLLRHTLATVAYRGGKAMRGAPAEFATYQPPAGGRTPAAIVAHMADLFDWAIALADGKRFWADSPPLAWNEGVQRFFAALEAFDRRLASEEPLAVSEEKLFQGPIADALTHVGQIAMLRRMAGYRARSENFFAASVEAGRVGIEQAPPVQEFD
jgi:hypothetical protein